MLINEGKTELLIAGGGPAGMGAAIEAAKRGVRTLLADENPLPGGQLYKQIHKFFGSSEHYSGIRGFRIAEELRKEAAGAGVEIACNCRVNGLLRDGRVVLSLTGPDKAGTVGFRSEKIVLATGGRENSLSFPGWTLPGVMSAGAAQTFCNIHRVLPGKRVMMVGSGNVGLIVAWQLLQAGAEVSGIVEIQDEIGGYYVHARKLHHQGIPFFTGYQVAEALGNRVLEQVRIRSLSGADEMVFPIDGLFLSTGLSPNSSLGELFGCTMVSEPVFGGALPLHDRRMRSSVEHVYVAGDAAGIEEANSSLDEGRLAGISVAEDLGRISHQEASTAAGEVQQRLAELRSGSHGFHRLEAKEKIFALTGPRRIIDPPAETAPALPPEKQARKVLQTSLERGRPLPFIDCPETIPCNPCVTCCPSGSISMKGMCGLPLLDTSSCTGCMSCLAACPGMAIILFGPDKDPGRVQVSIPWEYAAPGITEAVVQITDGAGTPLGEGEVLSCRMTRKTDRTAVLTLGVPKEYAHLARSIIRRGV